MKTYHAIGIMSGSSLDGLDIAYVAFQNNNDNWSFEVLQTQTHPLGNWANQLQTTGILPEPIVEELDISFGTFLGNQVGAFIAAHQIKDLDVIGSHGHTLFHYPKKGITCQIGNGQIIANTTKQIVVNNLRQADIDAGGAGAPIVPIGDWLLFKEFDYCLNLGGIANISGKRNEEIVSFDIITANQILNHYASKLGKTYDENGEIAASGKLSVVLLENLHQIEYIKQAYPKSLDNGFKHEIIQRIIAFQLPIEDILCTFCHFIGQQIHQAILAIDNQNEQKKMLVTGGGAHNDFLIDCIKQYVEVEVVIPNKYLVDNKEAIVMALIAVLRMEQKVNCLSSVTGASHNTVCGDVFHPKQVK